MVAVDAFPKSITLTPVNGGILGDVYNFDIAKISLI
jgi:hypothetical protein